MDEFQKSKRPVSGDSMSAELIYQCPQFNRCNAAFCPLSVAGSHLRDEALCLYLREAVKSGGEARVRTELPAHLADRVISVAREALSSSSALSRQLLRASKQASKTEIGKTLRASLCMPPPLEANTATRTAKSRNES